MATGIDVQKINALKVKLMDYIESINALSKRFENSYYIIDHNISGAGRTVIMSRLGSIREQIPVVVSNINSYITDLNTVQSAFENADQEFGSMVTNDIVQLDNLKGD